MRRDSADVAVADMNVAASRAALGRIRALTPPDAEWAAVRDAYAEVGEDWIRLATRELAAEHAVELQARIDALKARRSELRARI